MSLELNLLFLNPYKFIIRWGKEESAALDFAPPFTLKDRHDLAWYLETYSAHYTTVEDDAEAARIAAQLPLWGQKLFMAVFGDTRASNCFQQFSQTQQSNHLITISASHPDVLSLPWELLHTPGEGGSFLFTGSPRIAIRRRVAAKRHHPPAVKERLHLLFVVSRPVGSGFLATRADARAVLDALETHASGRVTVEFLRPATYSNLVKRLESRVLPPVDILHFDGHGEFDETGKFGDLTPQTGYLLFENPQGAKNYIAAQSRTGEGLGYELAHHGVSLVILSACQSGAYGVEEAAQTDESGALGSVAAGLTATGVPAVLAMSHKVLVPTTQRLFGRFYEQLAQGYGIATALEFARDYLREDPRRREVQRGKQRQWLELQDWCVPALYQAGDDAPLLQSGESTFVKRSAPPLKRSFGGGREQELWEIERAFADGAQCVTITGFAGQGKTWLAQESGGWLHRTGMFQNVVFVSSTTVTDPRLLERMTALRSSSSLLILDDIENFPAAELAQLLDAALLTRPVSKIRLLTTARPQGFQHPQLLDIAEQKRAVLSLRGLRFDEALDLFQVFFAPLEALENAIPPTREDLKSLFERVGYHPQCVRALSRALNQHPFNYVEEHWQELLVSDVEDNPTAAVKQSINRLISELRHSWLPKLGVFQGGAMEDSLLSVLEVPTDSWPAMRSRLKDAALIEVENLSLTDSQAGSAAPFLRFHPTLALVLWAQLSPEQHAPLLAIYRSCYFAVSRELYVADEKNPFFPRAVVRYELPNLLHAVRGALANGDNLAVEFADKVGRFLFVFGLKRIAADLNAASVRVEGDKQTWYFAQSRKGEQLLENGKAREAEKVFAAILETLGTEPTFERCLTLNRLGRCFFDQGRSDTAAQCYYKALDIANGLKQSDGVKRQRGALVADLGDVLRHRGQLAEARASYENSVLLAKEIGDLRLQGVANGQLGTMAMSEGDLPEAIRRYDEALKLFEQLTEPASAAVIWHQKGMLFQKERKWDEAERCYRESAEIEEALGNLAGAAQTWNSFAIACQLAGRLEAAEAWYRKAIDIGRELGDQLGLTKRLSNLADLLQNQPNGLDEAQRLATEALDIKKTLDPDAGELWKTYATLADIADKQQNEAQAREYRQRAREAYRNLRGTQYQIQQFMPLIKAAAQQQERVRIEVALRRIEQYGYTNLAAAIRRILDGERNAEVLCHLLDFGDALVVETILEQMMEKK